MKRVSFALAVLLLACGVEAATNDDTALPEPGESVILFVLDNSASLPPLDPLEKRRAALEMVFTFLNDQPYRLVLFGGRNEVYVDSTQHYRNNGQWTDFYFAFAKVKEIVASYPEGTKFRVILVTDGRMDPSPKDWTDQMVPPGADLRQVAEERTLAILKELGLPLYVMLVGSEVGMDFVESMVRASNGAFAGNRYSQGVSEFFNDDGVLLRRFIYRVEPESGLSIIEPIVRRIASPSSYGIEISVVSILLVVIAGLVGVGVRSFPGAGDQELLELRVNEPSHVAVDRLRRLSADTPSWSWRGLSLVENTKQATASFTAHEGDQSFPPEGLDLSKLDAISTELIQLPLPELRQRMDELMKGGEKEDMIEILNLDYVAPDFQPARAERLLTASSSSRRTMSASEFLRAKVHLFHNKKLFEQLTGARVSCLIYGSGAEKKELRPGNSVELGRYTFRVADLVRGGRKGYQMTLSYEKVPSPLFLKRIVPNSIQRLLRFRRTHERVVS